MERFRKWRKRENGEVMIESLLVYFVTLLLLFLILALMQAWYQRMTVNVVANDTAAKIASGFRIGAEDLYDATYDADDLAEMNPYRYWFAYDDLKETATEAAEDYATGRLARSSFIKSKEGKDTSVTFDIVGDGIGRKHVVVTLEGEYALPFGEVFGYFGMDDYASYTVCGYAECMDILSYINDVKFASTVASTIVADLGATGKLLDSSVTLINKIIGVIQEFMGE